MEDGSLKKLHLGLRMTVLIVAGSLMLSLTALWVGTRIYERRNNTYHRELTKSVASNVKLIADSDELKSIINDVVEVYENAPADLRDHDASEGGVSYSDDDGEYIRLYDGVVTDGYNKAKYKLDVLSEAHDVADVFVWVPDHERHRMVFVLFGNSEEYKSEAEPAGYWVDMFPDDEEYTMSPDPDGHYISYERIDERTGKNVRYMQCTIPLYPDDADDNGPRAFVTVDIEWKDLFMETMDYHLTFLLYMGILTVILTVIAQLVLRFSIVSPLKKAITEQERIESELALGANIQQSALPENVTVHFGDDDAVSVYGIMKPAKETGGDFFDHVLLDEDHLMLTIADVSGKGVPAALFMMMSKIFIDVYAEQGLMPGKALEMANDAICSRNREHMFVTVWLGILEISTGHLVAANAGHQKPVIRKAGGDFAIYDDPHGFVCGRFRKMKYESYELDLEKGDTLFVYTDGLTEAADTDKKLLGVDGMLKALNGLPREASPEEVCHHMQKAVEDHAKGIPQSDDLTMLCFKADN